MTGSHDVRVEKGARLIALQAPRTLGASSFALLGNTSTPLTYFGAGTSITASLVDDGGSTTATGTIVLDQHGYEHALFAAPIATGLWRIATT